MTDRDGLLPLDDEALLAQLASALDEHDPVPADAVVVARAAAALGRADDALAEMLFDSLLDEPELTMRSDVAEARLLAFQGVGHRLDVELLDDGGVLLGQIDPAAAAEVALETAAGTRTAVADDLGRFRFEAVRGPVRLRIRLGYQLVTPWITT